MKLWPLAVLFVGACGVFATEGGGCNENAECPTPRNDLVCFYGTCRLACDASTACGAGLSCTSDAGWKPFTPGGRHPGPAFGVCAPTCSSDSDCAPVQRCRFLTREEEHQQGNTLTVPTLTKCFDAPTVCGADGFCHATCSGTQDFCNDGSEISNDRCLDSGNGTFTCG